MSGVLQIQIPKSLLTQGKKKNKKKTGMSMPPVWCGICYWEGKKGAVCYRYKCKNKKVYWLLKKNLQECQCGQADIEEKNVRFATCTGYKYKYKKSLLTPEK